MGMSLMISAEIMNIVTPIFPEVPRARRELTTPKATSQPDRRKRPSQEDLPNAKRSKVSDTVDEMYLGWGSKEATSLWVLLWNKGNAALKRIITRRSCVVPVWKFNGSVERTEHQYEYMDLTNLIAHHSQTEGISTAAKDGKRHVLPCGSDRLLILPAYVEMMEILKMRERKHGFMALEGEDSGVFELRRRRTRHDIHSAAVIAGHPGIGKTWFLSYVLARRLCAGLPTVVQAGELTPNPQHLLFDGNGVRYVATLTDPRPVLKNMDIWALVDEKAHGVLANSRHAWHLVVSSSPSKDNLKSLRMQQQTPQYYLPTWDWKNLVAAA